MLLGKNKNNIVILDSKAYFWYPYLPLTTRDLMEFKEFLRITIMYFNFNIPRAEVGHPADLKNYTRLSPLCT